MPGDDNLYENLLQRGFTKQEIDMVLYKLTMLQLQAEKEARAMQSSFRPATRPALKGKRVLKQLAGKALCILKTQFAKKPKNPV